MYCCVLEYGPNYIVINDSYSVLTIILNGFFNELVTIDKTNSR